MNTADSVWTIRRGPTLIKVIVILNFLILVAALGPGRSHQFDLVLRRAAIEDLIGYSMMVWILGSTIFVSALFALMLWKKTRMPSGAVTVKLKLEGFLVLLWWVTILGFMAYGFMLGMGG